MNENNPIETPSVVPASPVIPTPVVPQPVVTQPAAAQPAKPSKTKDILTIVFLIIAYPIGWILMLVLTKWKVWVKILISVLGIPYMFFVFLILSMIAGMLLTVINPSSQMEKAKEAVMKTSTNKACLAEFGCAATNTKSTNCDTFDKIGFVVPSSTAGYNMVITNYGGIVTVSGTMRTQSGKTCTYNCRYDFDAQHSDNLSVVDPSACSLGQE